MVIDGALGEGGGQIFRSSLTLAMSLKQPVVIKNIRAGRSKPGLLRQHLACLRAAQNICDADVVGDELGSMEVMFSPGKVKAGNYCFAVGSAGSTTLIFQTLLLPLAFADSVSDIYFQGGAHNGFAPSYDFIESCFLPVMTKIGFKVDIELEQYGFYPAGGGAWKVRIHPTRELSRLSLLERGALRSQLAIATSSHIPAHITRRELLQVQKKCLWSVDQLQQRLVDSVGPGNIVSLRVESQNITEIIEAVGEKSLTAERVAGRAIKALKAYLNTDAPVGEYLADQLLLPMVLAKGGEFITLAPSQHFLTNVEVIRQFTGVNIRVVKENDTIWRIHI